MQNNDCLHLCNHVMLCLSGLHELFHETVNFMLVMRWFMKLCTACRVLEPSAICVSVITCIECDCIVAACKL